MSDRYNIRRIQHTGMSHLQDDDHPRETQRNCYHLVLVQLLKILIGRAETLRYRLFPAQQVHSQLARSYASIMLQPLEIFGYRPESGFGRAFTFFRSGSLTESPRTGKAVARNPCGLWMVQGRSLRWCGQDRFKGGFVFLVYKS